MKHAVTLAATIALMAAAFAFLELGLVARSENSRLATFHQQADGVLRASAAEVGAVRRLTENAGDLVAEQRVYLKTDTIQRAAATRALRQAIEHTDTTIQTLGQRAGIVLAQTSTVLNSTDQLLHTVDSAVIGVTAKSFETIDALTKDLKELEATEKAVEQLVSDPAWLTMARAGAGAGENLQEVTKTLDIATRGLRQAAGRVKAVLRMLLGMIKIDPWK